MKQECPTYLKSIDKSKAPVTTLTDIEPKADSDNSDQDGIISAFTAAIESSKEAVELVDNEEKLMESMFEKMDE